MTTKNAATANGSTQNAWMGGNAAASASPGHEGDETAGAHGEKVAVRA